jgi:ferredoxin-thioredoxin reductase catalytic subunit
MNENYENNVKRLELFAAEKGWILNPDPERVKKVVGLMTGNFEQHGAYYCPCKQSGDVPRIGEDVICPCPEAEAEIEKEGHCFCRLFFQPDTA